MCGFILFDLLDLLSTLCTLLSTQGSWPILTTSTVSVFFGFYGGISNQEPWQEIRGREERAGGVLILLVLCNQGFSKLAASLGQKPLCATSGHLPFWSSSPSWDLGILQSFVASPEFLYYHDHIFVLGHLSRLPQVALFACAKSLLLGSYLVHITWSYLGNLVVIAELQK